MNREFAQVRQWLGQAFAWSRGEYDRMARAATAKGLGLDPNQYNAPYPGTTNISVVNAAGMSDQPPMATPPTPQPPTAPRWLAALGIATALSGPLLGAAVALWATGGKPSPPAVQPTQPTPKQWEWKVDLWRDKDGKIDSKVAPIAPVEPRK